MIFINIIVVISDCNHYALNPKPWPWTRLELQWIYHVSCVTYFFMIHDSDIIMVWQCVTVWHDKAQLPNLTPLDPVAQCLRITGCLARLFLYPRLSFAILVCGNGDARCDHSRAYDSNHTPLPRVGMMKTVLFATYPWVAESAISGILGCYFRFASCVASWPVVFEQRFKRKIWQDFNACSEQVENSHHAHSQWAGRL